MTDDTKTVKDVYTMPIHDIATLGDWAVMRVPGGWIYTLTDYNQSASNDYGTSRTLHRTNSVFVPITKQSKEERMEALLNT